MGLTADACVRGVNAIGRQGKARRVQVRGGKAELVAELVARDNLGGERIGAAEQLAGGIEVARPDSFADLGAADDLAIQCHGGNTVHREVQFRTERLEQCDIPAPLMAEDEVRANANAVNVAEVAGKLTNKVFPGLLAESLVEPEQEQHIRPE
jgi:hypothetical protein